MPGYPAILRGGQDVPFTDVERRLGEMEAKLDGAWDQINRHIAGCEKLGIAAAESRLRLERDFTETRTRIEIIGSELTVKLDKLLVRMSEQDGAIKAGKALYAALGIIGAGLVWVITHAGMLK